MNNMPHNIAHLNSGNFVITSVHRDDLKVCFPDVSAEYINNIPDDVMSKLADFLEDDYCDQMFHDSLFLIAESMGIFDNLKIRPEE